MNWIILDAFVSFTTSDCFRGRPVNISGNFTERRQQVRAPLQNRLYVRKLEVFTGEKVTMAMKTDHLNKETGERVWNETKTSRLPGRFFWSSLDIVSGSVCYFGHDIGFSYDNLLMFITHRQVVPLRVDRHYGSSLTKQQCHKIKGPTYYWWFRCF